MDLEDGDPILGPVRMHYRNPRAGVLQSRAVWTTTLKAPVITMRRALATSRARLTSFGSGRRTVLRCFAGCALRCA
jgi:hypothetical protein